ncbi:hypothetical protein D3C72_2244990 [compost metagenome]
MEWLLDDLMAVGLCRAGGNAAGFWPGGDAGQQPAPVKLAGGGLQRAISQYSSAGATVLLVFRRRADPAFLRHAMAEYPPSVRLSRLALF